MYYTAQELIDDLGMPVSSMQEINDIVFAFLQQDAANIPEFFINWKILGSNDVENRPEMLYFPTLQDRDDFLNE